MCWLDDCRDTQELGCKDKAELDVIAGREIVNIASLELGVNVKVSLDEGECELLSCIAMEELAAADVKVSTETLAAASGWTVRAAVN